jgi:putative ABC transport system permease protein
MRNSDTGFSREGILVVEGPVNRNETWIEHDRKNRERLESDIFLNALARYREVKVASLSWSVPGEKSSIYGITLANNSRLEVINADSNYASVYGLDILSGKFDTRNGVVINSSSASLLGYQSMDDAIGKEFRDADGNKRTINGVIKDYHHYGLQEPIRPILFQENDPSYKLDSYYSLKIEKGNLPYNLKRIEEAYKQAYPDDPFEFYFIDSYFDAQYQSDIRFGKLFGLFSLLAIFIACMGLLGLALLTVNLKTKEIGIRKILGASVGSIVGLLTGKTLMLVLLSCILALPLAYWATEMWLSSYAYRIALGWVFVLPTLLVPIVVAVTISALSIKAAQMNPTDTLRHE